MDVLEGRDVIINKGQCCDGASNMVGTKTRKATSKHKVDSHAFFTHYHGHSLQLADGDTIKASKPMRGTLDIALE